MWTQFYAQPTSAADRCPQGRTCLKADEMDYFLRRDAKCYKMEQDSIEMAGKIEKYKVNEADYKANQADLKSQVLANKTLATNFQTTAIHFQTKYSDEKDKSKFRGKVLIGSLSLNLAFIALGVFLIKF